MERGVLRRGGLLLCVCLVVFLSFVRAADAQNDAGDEAQPTPTTVAASTPTTIATAEDVLPDDPAAKRLRLVTFGLLGLGGLMLVGTVVFWKVTRPPLLLPTARSTNTPKAGSSPDASPAKGTGSASPAKIPASVVLAKPSVPALPTMAAVAASAVATISGDAPTVPGGAPPPSGEPAIDAPPPLDDIALGPQQPLVGNDSAWIIEPESSSGLLPEPPSAGHFPEPEVAPDTPDLVSERADDGGSADGGSADDSTGGEVGGTIDGTRMPVETTALITALSAIPDKEPTVVRFDDPPVERVKPRPRRPAVASTPPDPAPTAPAGAPGFDRLAKEQQVTPAPRRVVDDMALMASALSSLPARPVESAGRTTPEPETGEVRHIDDIDDPADVPPVGDFYDQDLDPGHPPGQ